MSYNIPIWAATSPADLIGSFAKSYQKALDSDTTPLSVDAENGSAEFEGKHGHYVATLENCPCGSRPKPCKHMMRLAIELGIMAGKADSNHEKVLCRQITHESGISSADVRKLISSFDHDTQLLLHNIAESCKSTPIEETATLYLRTPAADELLQNGFVDETVGDYLHCSRSLSKEDVFNALAASGLDAPSSLFGRTSRWSKIFSHIQTLYESHPNEISRLFVVLSATAITKDKATVITRQLSPILYPPEQFEL